MKPDIYCPRCKKSARSAIHRDGTRLWDGTEELTPAEVIDSIPLKSGRFKNTYMCCEGHEWTAIEGGINE